MPRTTSNAKPAASAYNFKVVLLGEGCVGKTSILLRYVEDKFNTEHNSTLQASFLNKRVMVNDKSVTLNIWDTAGQERFHALGPIYYRGSHGAVLVYDITDDESFRKVKTWVRELKRMLGTEVVLNIVGNKLDLEAKRLIQHEAALAYAESVGALYCETSAKTNDGIEELFEALSAEMMQRQDQREQTQAADAMNPLRLVPASGGLYADTLAADQVSLEGSEDEARPSSGRSCCGTG